MRGMSSSDEEEGKEEEEKREEGMDMAAGYAESW